MMRNWIKVGSLKDWCADQATDFFLFFLCDEAAFGVGSLGELEALLRVELS